MASTSSAKSDVVSTAGSASDRNPAPACCMSRAITRRSVVSRERRSTAGITTTSPGARAAISFSSWCRSAVAPLPFSRNTFSQPAALSWASSTVRLFFNPSDFADEAQGSPPNAARPRRDLAFAVSSVGVAFTLFQIDDANWDFAKAPSLGLLLIGVWCLYAVGSAFALKLLRGVRAPLANILIGIRLLAVFYVIEMLIGTLFFLLTKSYDAFALSFGTVGFLLYVFYFPIILGKRNRLTRARMQCFTLFCVLLAIARASIAGQIDHRSRFSVWSWSEPSHESTQSQPPIK